LLLLLLLYFFLRVFTISCVRMIKTLPFHH
jgi:hypothetical protein